VWKGTRGFFFNFDPSLCIQSMCLLDKTKSCVDQPRGARASRVIEMYLFVLTISLQQRKPTGLLLALEVG
jgi:hypothetical protein